MWGGGSGAEEPPTLGEAARFAFKGARRRRSCSRRRTLRAVPTTSPPPNLYVHTAAEETVAMWDPHNPQCPIAVTLQGGQARAVVSAGVPTTPRRGAPATSRPRQFSIERSGAPVAREAREALAREMKPAELSAVEQPQQREQQPSAAAELLVTPPRDRSSPTQGAPIPADIDMPSAVAACWALINSPTKRSPMKRTQGTPDGSEATRGNRQRGGRATATARKEEKVAPDVVRSLAARAASQGEPERARAATVAVEVAAPAPRPPRRRGDGPLSPSSGTTASAAFALPEAAGVQASGTFDSMWESGELDFLLESPRVLLPSLHLPPTLPNAVQAGAEAAAVEEPSAVADEASPAATFAASDEPIGREAPSSHRGSSEVANAPVTFGFTALSSMDWGEL